MQRVTTIENDRPSSLDAVWLEYRRAVVKSVESDPKTLTNPHGTSLGRYYTIEGGSSECGEGVVQSVTALQILDYYPYGGTRVSSTTGAYNEQKQFIGQYTDPESSLSYLNARYYEGSRGQFLSQDPVFWEIGQTPDGRSVLANPQLQNSYSYGANNPITNKDPQGRCPVCAVALVYVARGIIVSAGINTGAQYLSDVYTNVNAQGVRPSSFLPRGESAGAYAQGLAEAVPTGFFGGVGGGLAKARGVSTLVGQSAGIGVGSGLNAAGEGVQSGDFSFGSTLYTGVTEGAINFGAGKIIGGVPGRDANLFTRNFFTGSHMRNEVQTSVTSQTIRSGTPSYSNLVSGLSQLVSSLSAYVKELKGNEKKK